MKKVGIIGWRGMVGSVLKERMLAEQDFDLIEPYFFSTSQAGQPAPSIVRREPIKNKTLFDAYAIEQLIEMDIILTTQGSDYTQKIHPQLRKNGWNGYWIDAASSLRMESNSIIVLDPINKSVIDKGINNGIKDYIGSNCSVSIMLMAIGGLFFHNEVEWVSSMTYQSASGSGAAAMEELLSQLGTLVDVQREVQRKSKTEHINILDLEKELTHAMNSPDFPKENFGHPLGGSLLPWIDKTMETGQSKEEWKGMAETNKILGTSATSPIPVDGTCVRIGSMRCHSMGFTIKLKRDLAMNDIKNIIKTAGEWVKIIPNEREASLSQLNPSQVSGRLDIPVGRLRKMNLGHQYLNAFTVGDQLLWGAAEPLRRSLRIIIAS